MTSKIAAVLCTAFLLTGCASSPKIIDKPILYDRPELILPRVQPVTQTKVEWTVITSSNANEKLAMLKSKENVTYFAVTSQGYQNLSLNVADLRRYIEQQNAVVAAYQAYYANLPKQEKTK
jgi:PBP1b-binding outer membrane lipoprotein LpoB